MTTPAPTSSPPAILITRIKVFVDYWNFQLTMNRQEAENRNVDDYRFSIDWHKLGPWLCSNASRVLGVDVSKSSYEGMNIYSSFNPKTPEGKRFKNWAQTWLDRQPGISVSCLPRRPKALPKCPICHKVIANCPHVPCGKPIVATVEKGVDTLIATDMIRLAWENAYDVAILASSDSDLVPAVEFLAMKGRKVIQAGFPPLGVDLATSSWGSFDVFKDRAQIERPPKV